MKTLQKIKAAISLCSMLLLSMNSEAQICPGHTIFNNTNCAVTINYKIFDGLTCATLCWGTVSIPGPGSYSIPMSCFTSTNADIELTVEYPPVGTGVFTTSVNFGSGPGGGGPWPCYNNGAPATMTYLGTGPAFCAPPFAYTVNVLNCFTTNIF